jgi:hypothetical protein
LYFTCKWQSLQLAVARCAFSALFLCYQKCLNFAVLKVLPSGCGGCCQSFVAEAVLVEVVNLLVVGSASSPGAC